MESGVQEKMLVDADGFNDRPVTPNSKNLSEAGRFNFKVRKVTESVSKKGFRTFRVSSTVTEGDHKGEWMNTFVTLLPFWKDKEKKEVTPGAGIILSFLASLGLPHKGKFELQPELWKGLEFTADVFVDQFEFNGEVKNMVKVKRYVPRESALEDNPKAVDKMFSGNIF